MATGINIRIVSSAKPEVCGIAEYTHHLADEIQDLTSEVPNCSITALRDRVWEIPRPKAPVDIQIDRRDPESWQRGTTAALQRASERQSATDCRTVLLAQHEYAFNENEKGEAGKATTFVDSMRRFRDANVPAVVTFHTIPKSPNKHFLKTTQDLAEICAGVIVLTESAPGTLRREPYNIRSDIVHIPHGIRVQKDTSEDARKAKKREYGYMAGDEELFLVLTSGLKSPGKGLHVGLEAYAKFVTKYLTTKERARTLWLVPGQFHPGFVSQKDGQVHREYLATLERIAKETKLNVKTVTGEPSERREAIKKMDLRKVDVLYDEGYQPERLWMDNFVAADLVFAPYDTDDQTSSGFIADAVGSSRVIIATPFPYSIDTIGQTGESIVGERGFLPGRNNPDEMAEAMYLGATNGKQRNEMSRRLGLRQSDMDWGFVAHTHVKYLTRIALSTERSKIIQFKGRRRTSS